MALNRRIGLFEIIREPMTLRGSRKTLARCDTLKLECKHEARSGNTDLPER